MTMELWWNKLFSVALHNVTLEQKKIKKEGTKFSSFAPCRTIPIVLH
jgi:hypothetical protein